MEIYNNEAAIRILILWIHSSLLIFTSDASLFYIHVQLNLYGNNARRQMPSHSAHRNIIITSFSSQTSDWNIKISQNPSPRRASERGRLMAFYWERGEAHLFGDICQTPCLVRWGSWRWFEIAIATMMANDARALRCLGHIMSAGEVTNIYSCARRILTFEPGHSEKELIIRNFSQFVSLIVVGHFIWIQFRKLIITIKENEFAIKTREYFKSVNFMTEQ